MKPHPDLDKFEKLLPAIRQVQDLATKHGIADIFQDNGAKTLWTLLLTGLSNLSGREGDDAVDETGAEFEMKSVNLRLQNQFTTHHHLNPVILAKYRKVDWIFTFFCGIELAAIYRLTPQDLEPLYSRWEQQYHDRGDRDLNNPKIPADFVKQHGTPVYQAPNAISLFQDGVAARRQRRLDGPQNRRSSRK